MGRSALVTISWVWVLWASFVTPLNSSQAAELTEAANVSEKAIKYYEVLRKRPEPGYLFDRFYNTWLDDSTAAELQSFLVSRVESKSTSDQLLLAFFFAKQGDDTRALEEFRSALAANPGSAEAWYQKAVVESRTLDFENAISDLRKARELKPEAKLQVQIDKLLGRLLVRNRHVDEALKVWNDLLAANPADEDLAEDLIELHIDEGLFEQAAKLTETLLAKTKDPYLAVTRRLRLGDVHQRAGNREASLKAYAKALEAVGHDSWLEQEILAQTEQLFRREDSLSQLNSHYEALLKEHPKRIALHRRQAQLLVELGEHDPAIAGYRQILELTPGDRANREEYVEVLAKIGKKKEAITELTELCTQHAGDAELKFRLATLLQDDGQGDAAAEQITEFLTASDKSEYAYLRAARQLERFERKEAAAGVYQDMAAAFADSASAQEAHAGFLYSTDKKQEALAIWRMLAEKAELSELLHVARALATRNENEAALELLQAREKSFSKEPLYFSQLATTALGLKKPELALPWTERRVELATSTSELESALDQAVAAADRANKIEDSAKRLAELEHPTVQQTCLRAELLELAGDSEAADAALKPLADAGDLLALGEQIRLFTQRRDWTAAADATRRMLELPGGRKSIYVRRLVELCQRDFQTEEALKWIEEWKRLSPGSTTPWTVEAGLRQGQGKEEDAIAVLKAAVQKFDGAEELRLRLAQVYSESDHLADAERIYWQLYEETEDVTGKLRWTQELTRLAEQQGKLNQLIEQFEERRQSNRQSIVPLLALSEVHRTADNYEGRRQALTAAAKIKPDDLELLHHISRVEEQEGDWDSAIATLQRAAPLDKTNRTKERIARIHLNNGNSEEGFAILFELAGREKGDPRTLETIADAMCGIQEWERAADFLASRVNDQPGDYRLRYLAGVTAEEAGRTNDAIAQFMLLLEDQEELPDVAKKSAQRAAQNPYLDMMGKMAPREAIDFLMQSQYRYQAYMHQQNRGTRFSLSGVAASANTIQMPSAVDQVRSMAVTHLMTMAKQLEEDELADLKRSMQYHGVESVDLMMRVDMYQGNMATELPAYLEEFPEDEIALALIALNQLGARSPELIKHSEHAYEKFRDSYPQLAILAAFQAGLAAEEELALNEEDSTEAKLETPNKLLDETLELAESIEEPNSMTVMRIALALSGQNGGQESQSLREAYRQKFSELLVKWYPKAQQQSNQYGSWAFVYIVGALAQGDDPAAYIAFLEDELARARQKGRGNANQAQAQAMLRQQMPTLLTGLAFPPQQLADFPAELLAVLRSPDSSDPFAQVSGRTVDTDFDAEKAAPLVAKTRDPILRVLLANRFEQKEVIEATLREMLASEKPQLDAYLLAAGKASADEDYVRAAELLNKARYLPMQRDLRSRVDAAIVATVMSAKEADLIKAVPAGSPKTSEVAAAEKESEPATVDQSAALLEAGRAACLRLRQTRLDANRRSELIAAMEDLGLKSEAEKLDQLAASQPAASTPSRVIYSAVGARLGSGDRVTKLVADGKRDAAAKLLATEVLGHARQMLSNPGNASYMRHQFRQIKTRVSTLGMTDDVLKAMDPGDNTTSQRGVEYAVACEAFGRPQEARATYEKLLEKKPKDDVVRMRLVVMLAATEPKLAEEHLKQLKPTASMSVGQNLMGTLQDYEAELESRVASAEIAAIYLKLLAGQPNVQTDWSEGFIQSLSRQLHTNNSGSLPSLLSTIDLDRNKSEAMDKLIERRRAAHEAICLEMLKTPNGARSGFTFLLAAAEARDKVNDDEFTARAVKLLREEAESRPLGAAQRVSRYSYSDNDSSAVRLRSPEEYLVRRATATDWKLIDEEVMPSLEKGRVKRGAETLAQMSKLYRCAPEEFLAATEQTLKQGQRSPLAQDESADLAVVVSAWNDRKLDADIQPQVLERLKRLVKSQNHSQTPPCVGDFVAATYRQRGGAAALELLEEVTTIYLGPKEKREAFVAGNNPQNGFSYGSATGHIYVYGEFISTLLQDETVLPIVIFYVQTLPSFGSMNNVEHYAYSGMAKLAEQPADKLMEALRPSPWMAELATFDPLDGASSRHGSVSWLAWFLENIGKDEKEKPAFAKLVAEANQQQPTFGLGLMNAHLQGSEALFDFCASQLEALQKLDEERQTQIAATLSALLGDEALEKKELSAPHAAVRDWLRGSKQRKSQQLLVQLREAKSLTELCSEPYEAGAYLGPHLKDLVAADLPAAIEAYHRVVELARDAQKNNSWNLYISNGSTAAGYILRQVAGSLDRDHYDRLPFLLDLYKSEKQASTEYESSNSYGVTGVLLSRFDELVKAKGKKRTPLEAVQQIHEELGEKLGGRPSSLFADAYCELCDQKLEKPEDLEAVREWAKSQVIGGGRQELSTELYAAASMVEAAKLAEKSEEKASYLEKSNAPLVGPSDHENFYRQYYRSLLQSQLPLVWRLHLAKLLTEMDGDRLPPETGKSVLATYTEALTSTNPITDEQHRSISLWLAGAAKRGELPDERVLWSDAWAKRYLRQSATIDRRFESPHELNDSDALCDVLRVYLQQNDDERVNQFFRRHESTLASCPQVVVILLRAEKPELAARFLRTNWSAFSLDWPSDDDMTFDAAIDGQTASLAEKLLRDDERYFARAMLASLPDPQPASAEDEKKGDDAAEQAADVEPTPRDLRLLKLAEEFSGATKKDEALRNRTIAILGQSRAANATLQEEIAAQYAKLSLPVTFQQDDDRRWRSELELASRHFDNRFAQGDTQAFVAAFDGIVASIEGDNAYQAGEKLNPLIESCYDSIKVHGEKWTPEQCAAVGRSLRSLLDDKEYIYLNEFAKFNALVLLTHAKGGNSSELAKWREELSGNIQRYLKDRGVDDETWTTLRKIAGKPTPENLPQRIKLVEAAVAAAADLEWLNYHQKTPHHLSGFDRKSIFTQIVKAKLLSRGELLAYASRIDPIPERHFMTNITLAEWLAAQKEYVAAAMLYDSARPLAPESWKVRRAAWGLRAGECWARAGNVENAQARADEAAKTELKEAEKERLKELTEMIEQKKTGGDEDPQKPNVDQPAEAPEAVPPKAAQRTGGFGRTLPSLAQSLEIPSRGPEFDSFTWVIAV
ncbi:Tetratricopeptide repeat protein [Lacipirellula limnantheis]|uniref:Tetratricopeptide repeat protein n=2 Tax=Lacipirellula limnantheis TaxID=2528024 RepID=A0A517TTK7_9BACT|nr:Tetratricopeptide repeat protein [Lacipirellula limnantheis]